MPLLEGLDGVNKMSKSLNNYIGITEEPTEMFGKIMSISDSLMWRYYELLSFRSLHEIAKLHQAVEEGKNPRDVKFLLAEEIVARFHNQQHALRAHEDFVSRFSLGGLPENLEEKQLIANDGGLEICFILRDSGLVSSTSEAFRMIKQGAVRIDGQKIADPQLKIKIGNSHLFQIGKRKYAKVLIVSKT